MVWSDNEVSGEITGVIRDCETISLRLKWLSHSVPSLDQLWPSFHFSWAESKETLSAWSGFQSFSKTFLKYSATPVSLIAAPQPRLPNCPAGGIPDQPQFSDIISKISSSITAYFPWSKSYLTCMSLSGSLVSIRTVPPASTIWRAMNN